MISLAVSEAYAYDMLAIATLKMGMNPKDGKAKENMLQLADQMIGQLGDERYLEVLESEEYEALYRVNREMYIRIDELKQREERVGDARYIDNRVYQRFLAKMALQKRWFPEAPLTEQKMGYGPS
jgi:hypothetical protein